MRVFVAGASGVIGVRLVPLLVVAAAAAKARRFVAQSISPGNCRATPAPPSPSSSGWCSQQTVSSRAGRVESAARTEAGTASEGATPGARAERFQ